MVAGLFLFSNSFQLQQLSVPGSEIVRGLYCFSCTNFKFKMEFGLILFKINLQALDC